MLKHRSQRICKEVVVFQKAEYTEIEHQHRRADTFFVPRYLILVGAFFFLAPLAFLRFDVSIAVGYVFFQLDAAEVSGRGSEYDKPDVLQADYGVKAHTCRQQYPPSVLFRCHAVYQQTYRRI